MKGKKKKIRQNFMKENESYSPIQSDAIEINQDILGGSMVHDNQNQIVSDRQLETRPDLPTIPVNKTSISGNRVVNDTLLNDQMISTENRQIVVSESLLLSADGKYQPQNQRMKSEASYESKGIGIKARNYGSEMVNKNRGGKVMEGNKKYKIRNYNSQQKEAEHSNEHQSRRSSQGNRKSNRNSIGGAKPDTSNAFPYFEDKSIQQVKQFADCLNIPVSEAQSANLVGFLKVNDDESEKSQKNRQRQLEIAHQRQSASNNFTPGEQVGLLSKRNVQRLMKATEEATKQSKNGQINSVDVKKLENELLKQQQFLEVQKEKKRLGAMISLKMKVYFFQKFKTERQQSVVQYPEIEFEPIKGQMSQKEYNRKSKYQQKIHNKQEQLFGQDLVHLNVIKFNEFIRHNNMTSKEKDINFTRRMSSNSSLGQSKRQSFVKNRVTSSELNSVITTNKKKTNESIFQKIIIRKDNTQKAFFDIMMMFVSCYNIYGNAYFAAFGISDDLKIVIINQAVETMFLMDIVFTFCQEYLDEETYKIVSDIKQIAMHYLKGTFIFDFLAWIPFEYIFYDYHHVRLFRLLKLLRVPRLAALINVDNFKQLINEYYDKQLQASIKNNNTAYYYPIKFALKTVKAYEIFALIIIIFTISYFFGVIWIIITKDLENWQQIQLFDIYQGYQSFYGYDGYGFIHQKITRETDMSDLIKVWYYGLTTLSTIGFGDFAPKSTYEKLIIAFVMLFGVVVFSYIMGNLIEIMLNINNLDLKPDHRELTKWIALLSKFNDGAKLPKSLVSKIEDHFNFYWEKNPLAAFQIESDKAIYSQLPMNLVHIIYTEYLFRDFLYLQKNFLTITQNGYVLNHINQKYRKFIFSALHNLEPRQYLVDYDDLAQDQFVEVFEVMFIMKGCISVGYRLFDEIFFAKVLRESDRFGDYDCSKQRVSEFLYKANTNSHGFAMKRMPFIELISSKLGKQLLPKIEQEYHNSIRLIVYKHRLLQQNEMTLKYDYIGIQAFGIDQELNNEIQLDQSSFDFFQQQQQQFAKSLHDLSSEGKVIQKLFDFDKELDAALVSLKQMTKRHDDRIEMIKSGKPDKDQIDFLIKLMRDFQKAQIIIKQSSTMKEKRPEKQQNAIGETQSENPQHEGPSHDHLGVMCKSYTRYLRNNKNSLSERNVR